MHRKLHKRPYHGHRRRLRERFKKTGLEGFHDYEFIELLLTYAIPQRDVKLLAKELLQHFGGIKGVFDASVDALLSVKGIGERSAILIKLLKDGAALYLKTRIERFQPVFELIYSTAMNMNRGLHWNWNIKHLQIQNGMMISYRFRIMIMNSNAGYVVSPHQLLQSLGIIHLESLALTHF